MPSTKRSSASAAVNNKANSSSASSRPAMPRNASPTPGEKSNNKVHKRSRSGCFTCRLRRKKCDEAHPACGACTNLNVRCEYKRPVWWGNSEQRRLQKERIKNKIKQTKSLERSNMTHDNINRIHLDVPPPSPPGLDLYHPFIESYDSFGPHFASPGFVPISYGHYTPYEIDVRTERHIFVNDVPLRQDSSMSSFSAMGPPLLQDPSVSTFSSMGPPQLDATLPTFPAEEGLEAVYLEPSQAALGVEPTPCAQGVEQSYDTHDATMTESDCDMRLYGHFVQNVLPMAFPILELHQQGSAHAGDVLFSLANNISYFHCCMSVAAIHLKTISESNTSKSNGNRYDQHIMRHRVAVIAQLNEEMSAGFNVEHILDTALAMILFPCSVGVPEPYPAGVRDGNPPDEKLLDVPWTAHFEGVFKVVNILGLNESLVQRGGFSVAPFKMSLTSWIDILGATMLGRTPQFVKNYRDKHDTATSSGLRELMGCDDRVMYIIAEIACLEGGMNQGTMDEDKQRRAFSTLEGQLNEIEREYQPKRKESEDRKFEIPYSTTTGPIRPDVLTKNISTVFLDAARIYLRSLVPGADRDQKSISALVDAMAKLLEFPGWENHLPCEGGEQTSSFSQGAESLSIIPAGPSGFDRSLVWPLFIAGIFSTPGSHFRNILNARFNAMKGLGRFGNLGRMYQLLIEYWASIGDPVYVAETMEKVFPKKEFSVTESKTQPPPLPFLQSPGMREIRKKKKHWRDLMSQNEWWYLLI